MVFGDAMPTDKNPEVAVIMPVYYRERPEFLKASMRSIFEQSYRDISLHLYQDGPFGEDLTRVVKSFSDQYPNLTVYLNSKQRGSAICANEMITKLRIRYPYIARMDSDDISLPDRIAKQVAFLENHPDVDVVGGFIIDVDERGKEVKKVKYPLSHEEIRGFFKKRNPMAHVTVMYRRSYFDKAGLYPPVRLEDGLYWMQGLAGGCRFENIPDYLVYVRRTDDFLKRRSGFKMVWGEFLVKLTINHKLRYGPSAYFYALATLCMQLLPVPLKQVLYDKLR